MLQVFDKKQQVERHSVFFQYLQSADNIGTNNEIIVRFVLRYMADANELWMDFEFQQLFFAFLTCQVHPTHDACDELVSLGHAKYPAIFLNIMLRLDEDRPVNAELANQWFEVFGKIVTPDRRVLPRPATNNQTVGCAAKNAGANL